MRPLSDRYSTPPISMTKVFCWKIIRGDPRYISFECEQEMTPRPFTALLRAYLDKPYDMRQVKHYRGLESMFDMLFICIRSKLFYESSLHNEYYGCISVPVHHDRYLLTVQWVKDKYVKCMFLRLLPDVKYCLLSVHLWTDWSMEYQVEWFL